MFPNLVRLLSGRPPPELEHSAFVRQIDIGEREKPNPRVERLILFCWLLIAVKHVGVLWAVYRYSVPFNALWVNLPTWLLGVLATGLYLWRVRRR